MSSNRPAVRLTESVVTALVSAIPIIAQQTERSVVLVGGLAVMCRLSTAYRATTDLDTVDRRGGGQVGQLELLLAAGAESSGPSGAMVETPFGLVQVDIIRLTLDRTCGPTARDQLGAASAQLRADALLHARRWFDEGVGRLPTDHPRGIRGS